MKRQSIMNIFAAATMTLTGALSGCGLLNFGNTEDYTPKLVRMEPNHGKNHDLVRLFGVNISNPLRDTSAALYFGDIKLELSNDRSQKTGIVNWDPSVGLIAFFVPIEATGGEYEVHLTTEYGESNTLTFTVGDVASAGVPQEVVGWVLHENSATATIFKSSAKFTNNQWTLSTSQNTAAVDGKQFQYRTIGQEGWDVVPRDVIVDSGQKISWVAFSAYDQKGPGVSHAVRPFVEDYLTQSTDVEVGVGPVAMAAAPDWSLVWVLGAGDDSLTGVEGRTLERQVIWKVFLQDLDRLFEPLNLLVEDRFVVLIGNDRATGEGVLLGAAMDANLPEIVTARYSGYHFSGPVAQRKGEESAGSLFVAAETDVAGTTQSAIVRIDLTAFAHSVTTGDNGLRAGLLLGSGSELTSLNVVPRRYGAEDSRIWTSVVSTAFGVDYVLAVSESAFADGVPSGTDLSTVSEGRRGAVPGDSTTSDLIPSLGDVAVKLSWPKGVSQDGETVPLTFALVGPDTANAAAEINVNISASSGSLSVTSFTLLPSTGSLDVTFTAANPVTAATLTWTATDSEMGGTVTSVSVVEASSVASYPLTYRFDNPAEVGSPQDLYWIKDTPFMLVANKSLDSISVLQAWDAPFFDHQFPSYNTGPIVIYCGQKVLAATQ